MVWVRCRWLNDSNKKKITNSNNMRESKFYISKREYNMQIVCGHHHYRGQLVHLYASQFVGRKFIGKVGTASASAL